MLNHILNHVESSKISQKQLKHTKTGLWFGTFFTFPYIGNVVIPIDYIIFFRGFFFNHQPEKKTP